MVKKLTSEQLKRYREAEEAKAAKVHVTVDEQHRKNLQAWIPLDLWTSVKAQISTENTSMNEYVARALATYMLLKDEDIERILARHKG